MPSNGSRYHGEIQVAIGPNQARINVFSDSMEELFLDLATIQAQFGPADPVTNPAKRAIVNAERIAAQRRNNQPMSANGRPLPPNVNHDPDGLPSEVPTCVHCGQWDGMELIEFQSKKDGKTKRAWKCQACDKWHFPEKKGR
jgi:hypothetical protein